MQISHRHSSRSAQRGVGILEVLIAVVVVSLGMLGVAGLQLTGMKHSTGGFNRSKATLYAEDIASRMRVNKSGVLDAAYDGHDSSAANYCSAFAGPRCDAGVGSNAQSCSTDQLAAFDLFTVSCGIDGTSGVNGNDLPNAVLTVDCNATTCTSNESWTINVQWTEGDSASDTAGDIVTKRVLMRLKP